MLIHRKRESYASYSIETQMDGQTSGAANNEEVAFWVS